jgi:DNA-binding NtrC family response regulator
LQYFIFFVSCRVATMNHARVLIVDDEPSVRQVISEWLRRKNFHVLEAEGGRQAMERIRRDKPDVVVSDVVMPEMNGIQLLTAANTARTKIPFLMISGYPSHLDAVKVMKNGALDYLAKPFHPDELTRRIHRLLLQGSAGKSHAQVRGIALGAAISAILWALIIGVVYAMIP